MYKSAFSVAVCLSVATTVLWSVSTTAWATDCEGDTTPPKISCELIPTTNPADNPADKGEVPAGEGKYNPDGFFLVRFSARDDCDPKPKVTATLCGFPVYNCEKVKFTQAPGRKESELVYNKDGMKHIICPCDPELVVTAVDASGNKATKTCGATVPPAAAAFRPAKSSLGQNYPNPFNPETWIPYELHEASGVTVTIYNWQGRRIRGLMLGEQPAGVYRARERAAYWDGRNDAGERVASGLYLYELRAGNYRALRRMLVLK